MSCIRTGQSFIYEGKCYTVVQVHTTGATARWYGPNGEEAWITERKDKMRDRLGAERLGKK